MRQMDRFDPGGDEMSVYENAANVAARRGDVDELELNLARLRMVAPSVADDVAGRLRGLARCVRSHPSFRSAAGSQVQGLAG